MPAVDSVTQWLHQLRLGDNLAAERLWQRYVEQLVNFARSKLGNRNRRVADEEDVVAVVMESAFRNIGQGRFAKLDDRDDLWQVLVMMTERRAIDQQRREMAQIRGGGQVRGDSLFSPSDSSPGAPQGIQLPDNEPTPAFAAQTLDELEFLLQKLGDDSLRTVALERLMGYTNPEIAERTGNSLRSVERKLNLIRKCWENAIDP